MLPAIWMIYVLGQGYPMILADSPRFATEAECKAVVDPMNAKHQFEDMLGVCIQFGTVRTRRVYKVK